MDEKHVSQRKCSAWHYKKDVSLHNILKKKSLVHTINHTARKTSNFFDIGPDESIEPLNIANVQVMETTIVTDWDLVCDDNMQRGEYNLQKNEKIQKIKIGGSMMIRKILAPKIDKHLIRRSRSSLLLFRLPDRMRCGRNVE